MFPITYEIDCLAVGRMRPEVEQALPLLKHVGSIRRAPDCASAERHLRQSGPNNTVQHSVVTVLDSEKLSKLGERHLSIGSVKDRKSVQNRIIVLISESKIASLESRRLEFIQRMSAGVVLIMDATSNNRDGLYERLNMGLFNAVCDSKLRSFRTQFSSQIERLRRLQLLAQLDKLGVILGNGATTFLNDDLIRDHLIAQLEKFRSPSAYLSLEPPGFLLSPKGEKSAFILICDRQYKNGLSEITSAQRSAGSLKAASDPPYGKWLRLAEAGVPMGRGDQYICAAVKVKNSELWKLLPSHS